jgi:hypothetical protein
MKTPREETSRGNSDMRGGETHDRFLLDFEPLRTSPGGALLRRCP